MLLALSLLCIRQVFIFNTRYMLKKIYISSLVFILLISTTGLTYTFHLCKMMGSNAVSECELCMIKTKEVNTKCCEEEKIEYAITIDSENPLCCRDEIISNRVEDEFSNIRSYKSISNITLTILKPVPFEPEKKENYQKKNNFNLPPPKFGKQLLKTIHQLKIDLPLS